mgnify:CR=1 FL=1
MDSEAKSEKTQNPEHFCHQSHQSHHPNIVRGFLEEVFGKDRILDGRVDWCVNPVTNYKLPFDMIIGDWKIIIDVDGEQHFKDIKIFKSGLIRDKPP